MRNATLLLVPALLLAATRPAPDVSPAGAQPERSELQERVERLRSGIERADSVYRAEVEPLTTMLATFSDDSAFVRTLALALVGAARDAGLDPRLLTAVLLVENPWLDPAARSPVGAVGLLQVMPFHAGRWGCPGSDLEDIATNLCHGARLLRTLVDRSGGDMERALLRYNGCVRGRNTSDCHLYPAKVYARAGEVLVRRWLDVSSSP